ncbi:hypothetical protein WJX73_009421 [Symbiochloris irregularis]|uniref:Uncharacterized protein n=1 Tax=Symbiochloris irregularis TaxID=706552 RepID=A0AAW1PVS9_9CHLO
MRALLSLVLLGSTLALSRAQGHGPTPTFGNNGSILDSVLYIQPPNGLQLVPQNTTYNRTGCFDSAPTLSLYFGPISIPAGPNGASSADTVGLHTYTTVYRHNNATSGGLYELVDNMYWNLLTGAITVFDQVVLLSVAPDSPEAAMNTEVADYDVLQMNNTINPNAFPGTNLTSAWSNGSQLSPFLPGNATYFAPREGATYQSTANTQLYVKYLQRILYLVETLAVSDSSRCLPDYTGQPQLANLTDFTAKAVQYYSAMLTPAQGGLSKGFADGQPVDLTVLTSNDTQAAAVCLVKNNSAIQTGTDSVYAISGNISGSPFAVADAGACCAACALPSRMAASHGNVSQFQCNFWFFCGGDEQCLFPNGNGILSKGQCVLGQSQSLMTNESWGEPIYPPQVGRVDVALAWPIVGITLPTRGNNMTQGYGNDAPVPTAAGAQQYVSPDGALFYA